MVVARDFLRFADEEIANIQVGRLNDTKVKEVNKANEEVAETNTEETVLGITEATSQETDSEDGTDISYQPLNEGIYTVSGTALPTISITNLVNNNVGIHKENENSIDATTEVDPTQIEVNGVINQENSAAGKMVATAAVAQARSAEKAKGGVHIGAAANLKFTGKNVINVSEGTLTSMAPIISEIGTTVQRQSNQTLETSNLFSYRGNVASYNWTDGKTEVSGSNFTAVRENSTIVAKNLVNKAVEQLESTADSIISNAGKRNIMAAQKVVAIEAGRQAGINAGDIAFTAASSNILEQSDAAASAGSIPRTIATPSFGNMTFVLNSENPAGGNFTTNANFVDNSSKTDIINTAGIGLYNGGRFQQSEFNFITQVSEDAFVNYSLGAIITTDGRTAHVTQGGRHYFIKGFHIPKRSSSGYLKIPRRIIDLPAKTKLPGGVTKGQLNNCIPTKFKTKREDAEDEKEDTSKADEGVTPKKTDVSTDNQSAIPGGDGSVISVEKPKDGEEKETTNIQDGLRDNKSRFGFGVGSQEGGVTDLELSSLWLGTSSFAFLNIAPPLAELLLDGNFEVGVIDNPFDPDREDGDSKDANVGGTDEDTTPNANLVDLDTAAFNYISGQTIQDAADAANISDFPAIFELKSNIQGTIQYVLAIIKLNNGDITAEEYTERVQASGVNSTSSPVQSILEILVAEVEVRVSIGGVIQFGRSVFGQVSTTINVVANEVTDAIETVNDIVRPVTQIYNEVRGLPVVGNLGIWNVLDPIVSNTSSTFNQLFRASRALTRNPNYTFTEVLGRLVLKVLERRINQALKDAGINLTVAQLAKMRDFLFKVSRTNLGSANRRTQLDVRRQREFVIRGINEIVNDEFLSFSIYTALESLIRLIENGNVENLVSRDVITSLVGYIVGPAGMALIRDVANVYVAGRKLYQAVLAAPALLKLMNEYKMPPLARVTTLLSCLDLMNRLSNVIEGIAKLVNRFDGRGDEPKDNTIEGSGGDDSFDNLITVDTTGVSNPPDGINEIYSPDQHTPNKLPAKFFSNREDPDQDPDELIDITEENCQFIINPGDKENFENEPPTQDQILDAVADVPRLYQILNSVKEFPSDSVAEIDNSLLSPEEIASLRTAEPLIEGEGQCFVAPKLNFLEATIKVREIHKASILFEVPALSLLKYNNKDTRPTTGTLINVKVSGFINNKNGKTYTVSKEREFYSASTYTFQVTEFREEENLGLAVLIPLQSTIYLQDSEQITFSYDVMDIGRRLTPMIVDAYLSL